MTQRNNAEHDIETEATDAQPVSATNDGAVDDAADYDRARRKLLKLGAYVIPAVTAMISTRTAWAQTISCAPAVCSPNACVPTSCEPYCAPAGGCAPASCGPVGCVPSPCGPSKP